MLFLSKPSRFTASAPNCSAARRVLGVAQFVFMAAFTTQLLAQQTTVRVGIVGSFSGTMAMSSGTTYDAAVRAVDELNGKGGVLGRQVEKLVVDGGSDKDTYLKAVHSLARTEGVSAIFVGDAPIDPSKLDDAVKGTNTLLFYPGRAIGSEKYENVFSTGAVPKNLAIPALDYALNNDGGPAQQFFLIGTDTVLARTSNRQARRYLLDRGIDASNIREIYVPHSQTKLDAVAKTVAANDAGRRAAILLTLTGNQNVEFHRSWKAVNALRPWSAQLRNGSPKIFDLGATDDQLQGGDRQALVGSYVINSYLPNTLTTGGRDFAQMLDTYKSSRDELRGSKAGQTVDEMEASYTSVGIWKYGVESANTTDASAVKAILLSRGQFDAPSGTVAISAADQSLLRPVTVSEVLPRDSILRASATLSTTSGWYSRSAPDSINISIDQREKGPKLVRTYFATDRKIDRGQAGAKHRFTGERGTLSYGVAEVSIPPGHEIGQIERPNWIFRLLGSNTDRHMVLSSTELTTESDFFKRINASTNPSQSRAFVFVHGYNVSFEDAALRTAQLGIDLQIGAVPVFYSWPSKANEALYMQDEQNAEWAISHLSNFLSQFAAQSDAKEIFVIAHSMGARVATRALMTVFESKKELRSRFAEIVLAAPDIDAAVFLEQILPKLKRPDTPLTLYASSEDKALQVSQGLHGHTRAGLGGSSIVVEDGVETIDASRLDTDFLGHSYVVQRRELIADLSLLLHNKIRAANRPLLDTASQASKKYWIFKR